MRTLAELAKEALEIQDGSNVSGLVLGWSRAVMELRKRLEERGITDTSEINQHSINKLWADKLHDLTRTREALAFSAAMDECHRLVAESSSGS